MAPATERRSLRAALQADWRYLIGMAVIPPLLPIVEALDLSFMIVLVPFFIASAIAMWPWLSGRAPFSFWGIACVVWLGSGAVTAIVAGLVRGIAI
jgi:hypothetical protein